jgi:hypothetical protein
VVTALMGLSWAFISPIGAHESMCQSLTMPPRHPLSRQLPPGSRARPHTQSLWALLIDCNINDNTVNSGTIIFCLTNPCIVLNIHFQTEFTLRSVTVKDCLMWSIMASELKYGHVTLNKSKDRQPTCFSVQSERSHFLMHMSREPLNSRSPMRQSDCMPS